MNGKIILLVVGLLIGALIGYLERPESAEINLGPLHVEVQGDQPRRKPPTLYTPGETPEDKK